MKTYELRVRKDHLKFSAAHMTVFGPREKERLHGHNYYVEVAVEYSVPDEGHLLPVARLKDAARAICLAWNERTLLPQLSPYLTVDSPASAESVRFTLCGKRYELPAEDIAWVPRLNLTIETLADEFLARFERALRALVNDPVRLHWIEVVVEETVGQGARQRKTPDPIAGRVI